MFLGNQSNSEKDKYIKLLQKVGALSNLFSDSKIPYLHYRISENIFCRAFNASNHSRSDTLADAGKDKLGIGIKTFGNKNGKTLQKISEFNRDRSLYIQHTDSPELLVKAVCMLRNERIDFAKSVHGLDNLIYHCITRDESRFLIFEEEMKYVNINNLTVNNINGNSIFFNDGNEEYQFNLSKSTMFKRFITVDPFSIPISMIDDPLSFLENLDLSVSIPQFEKVVLPLYSETRGNKYVPEKSGLNQWNANGRRRKNKEVYIRIPSWIHRSFPQFFPSRNVPFILTLPNNSSVSASVCQQGRKALMSNPNTDLGDWLIDHVLKIPEDQIVTYDTLKRVGVDSVEVRKSLSGKYEIDFKSLGTYEGFERNNNK